VILLLPAIHSIMCPAKFDAMTVKDIRDRILFTVGEKKHLARITSQGHGVLSGIPWLRQACRELGIRIVTCKKTGEEVRPSEVVALLEGPARQLVRGEEELMGWVSKSSGIATAARKAKKLAGKNFDVVSGAWKKMPPPIKQMVRQAIADGGLRYRISERPFIYLDKNYVKLLGGVEPALNCVKEFKPFSKVVQLKSRGRRLTQESILAAQHGANIIMIDTGRSEDIERVHQGLRKQGLRERVKIAFGGNIALEDLTALKKRPVDIVDLGRAIVDAPLLDMRMDIIDRR
jgi:nicotinate-nucleotide pyrophosphorylase (carboxylating)